MFIPHEKWGRCCVKWWLPFGIDPSTPDCYLQTFVVEFYFFLFLSNNILITYLLNNLYFRHKFHKLSCEFYGNSFRTSDWNYTYSILFCETIHDFFWPFLELIDMASATSEPTVESCTKPAATSQSTSATPQTPVLTVACRMLRSPSHESVTTDLSLFSVTSLASDAGTGSGGRMRLVTFKSYNEAHITARGLSPNPPHKRY